MARSVVDLGKIKELRAAISAYSKSTDETVAAFLRQALSLLSQFETKLSALERIREQKSAALSRCEVRKSHDEHVSCASEEAAYQEACAKCQKCAALVAQARFVINEFESRASHYRTNCHALSTRAATGLERVEAMINSYSADTVPNTDSGSGNSSSGYNPHTSIGSQNQIDDAIIYPDSSSSIHISGGERIARVLSGGTSANPVYLDFDAMSQKYDHLPDIVEPDRAILQTAAVGILGLLAAGGIAVGTRELLIQQKADEIFENKYGISRTQLLIGTGSKKQKEYIDAYNKIYKGIQNEIKEEQKKKLLVDLNAVTKALKDAEGKHELGSIEDANKLRVDKENLENRIATLEDGKRRPHKPYGKTYVAGLSEDGLKYMLDYGNMSPGRYAAVLNILAQSEYSFESQRGKFYSFVDGFNRIEIAQDGSKISFEHASNGISGNVDVNIVKSGEGQATLSLDKEKIADLNTSPALNVGLHASYTPVNVSVDAMNYEKKNYSITEHGGIISSGIKSVIGINGTVSAEAGFSADVNTHLADVGGEVKASASVAEASVKGEIFTRPILYNGEIVQLYTGVSFGADAGASASAVYELTEKGFHGKTEISAGIKMSGNIGYNALLLKDLPETIAQRMSESIPTGAQIGMEMLEKYGEMEMARSKYGRYGW